LPENYIHIGYFILELRKKTNGDAYFRNALYMSGTVSSLYITASCNLLMVDTSAWVHVASLITSTNGLRPTRGLNNKCRCLSTLMKFELDESIQQSNLLLVCVRWAARCIHSNEWLLTRLVTDFKVHNLTKHKLTYLQACYFFYLEARMLD